MAKVRASGGRGFNTPKQLMVLRVAYIVDGTMDRDLVAGLVAVAGQSRLYLPVALIEATRASPRAGLLFAALTRLEKFGLGFSGKYGRLLASGRRSRHLERLSLAVEAPDELRKNIADITTRLDIDLIVDISGHAFRDDERRPEEPVILTVTGADDTETPLTTGAFFAVEARRPATGFRICRLGTNSAPDRILREGHIATVPLYFLNCLRLMRKTAFHLHRLIEAYAETGTFTPVIADAPPTTGRRVPESGHIVSYFAKTIALVLRNALDDMRGRAWRWQVAYLSTDDWRKADLGAANQIPNERGRFLADPHLFKKGDDHVCFVEEFDYRTAKGHIAAYALEGTGARRLGTVLEEDFHLSFPFVFEVDGTIYMCPESHKAGDIRLYECVEFPTVWRLHKILMTDVSAADTVLFRRDGLWWMMTNIDTSDIGDHSSELHIFFAGAPDADNWTPHPRNPVVFDSRRARNGGFFVDDGAYYRVFQVQDFDIYGAAAGIARIVELTETSYREDIVDMILPDFRPDIGGVHSIVYRDGVLAFDVARRENRWR